jgi:hypothetical protein
MDGFQFFSAPSAPPLASLTLPARDFTEAQLALTPLIARQAFAIRHRGYLSYGYITPREDGLFCDKYDGRANERTIVIYRAGRAAATIRVCLYDPNAKWPDADMVPAMEIFGPEIGQLCAAEQAAGRSGRMIEITRFARDPAFANDHSLIISAFRIVAYLRLYFDASVMLNAVRPHHMPMYRRLGFQKLEEPRKYPNLTYSAGLMAMFTGSYDAALRKIGFPHGVSRNDPIYEGLMAGQRVQVYTAEAHNGLRERLTGAAAPALADAA